jgi:hypothetical protein
MGAVFRGTFVISWSQTEVDGLKAAPLECLATGATWRWTGEAVRVDGPQGVLVLDGAEGQAELRARASRTVRRLIGAAVGGMAASPEADLSPPVEDGFSVTDGRTTWVVTMIDVPDTGARLLIFAGEAPPAGCDLWVVRVDRRADSRSAEPKGGVICFTPGTLLRTETGLRAIEDLRPGDRLQTRDNGSQPVLWTGSRRMTGARLYAMPHLRPVRFRMGAMGIGRPDRDLLVSPRHRMLIRGPAARALFNSDEVLVAAEDLVNGHGIAVDHLVREVTYVHVLLERHQVVWANGLETESFHPGMATLDSLDPRARADLLDLVPGVDADPGAYGPPARRNLTGAEAAILRHDIAA